MNGFLAWLKKYRLQVAIGGALLVAATGGISWWTYDKKAKAQKAAALPVVQVIRRDITTKVVCNGKVVSNQDVEVKCKAGGQIIGLPFDISQVVKKGDVLVQLDPVDEKRKLKQAEVQLAASRAKLASAQQNLATATQTLATDRRRAQADLTATEQRAADAKAKAERMRQLLEKNLCSREEFDTVATTAAQAEADLEGTRVKLAELETQEQALEVRRQDVKLAEATVAGDEVQFAIAEDRLRDTTVFAPVDGVVSKRDIQIGQIIASAVSNVGGGTSLMIISDLSRMFVLAAVDESDIGKMKVGQRSIVTVDAWPGKLMKGEVVRVATRGTNTANVVTFEVKIEVKGEEKDLLKPEMTANLEIQTERKLGVLSVPVNAVARRAENYVVQLVKGKEKKEAPVKIGLNDGNNIEVISGVAEGDSVELFRSDAGSKWNSSGPQAPKGMSMGMMPRPPSGGSRK